MNTTGPDSRLQPSTVVGDYRLIRPLGEGGMGSVWLAEHAVLPKRFAIKFLLRDYASNTDAWARFEQEARTIGGLDHPNVVSAVNYGVTSEGQPYLVMEALTGKSLGELLEDSLRETGKPLPAARAIELVRQACAGVAHAHAHGVIHRDLKPDNLFAARTSIGTEQVKVLDFGIAKIRDTSGSSFHKTQTGTVLGTPYYMSPEQARGESNIDFVTDVYSLTAILYELLSGTKPHDGNQYNALIADIIERDPTPLDERKLNLPPGLSAVLVKGMERSRTKRYQAISELERALATFGNWPLDRVSTQRVEQLTSTHPDTTSVAVSLTNASQPKERPATASVVPSLNGDSLAPSAKGHTRRRNSWALMASAATLLAGISALVWIKLEPSLNEIGHGAGARVHADTNAATPASASQSVVNAEATLVAQPNAAGSVNSIAESTVAQPKASENANSIAVVPVTSAPASSARESEKGAALPHPKTTAVSQPHNASALTKPGPRAPQKAPIGAKVQVSLPRNPYSKPQTPSR